MKKYGNAFIAAFGGNTQIGTDAERQMTTDEPEIAFGNP